MTDLLKSLRTWVEIDLDALDYNFNCVRKSLPDNVKVLAVVKANAYGHGAVKVAKFFENKADYLAVAATDEALEIRKSGVDSPILILGHIPYGDYDNVVKYGFTPTVSDLNEATLLSQSAVKFNKAAKLHIAVDTGMSRIGFADCDESVEEIKKICELPNVTIEGVFSHFAAADVTDKTYTNLQISRF